MLGCHYPHGGFQVGAAHLKTHFFSVRGGKGKDDHAIPLNLFMHVDNKKQLSIIELNIPVYTYYLSRKGFFFRRAVCHLRSASASSRQPRFALPSRAMPVAAFRTFAGWHRWHLPLSIATLAVREPSSKRRGVPNHPPAGVTPAVKTPWKQP